MAKASTTALVMSVLDAGLGGLVREDRHRHRLDVVRKVAAERIAAARDADGEQGKAERERATGSCHARVTMFTRRLGTTTTFSTRRSPDPRLHPVVAEGQLPHLIVGGVDADEEPAAYLAVDLDDDGHLCLLERRRIGDRPALLEETLAVAELIPQLLGHVRAERARGDAGWSRPPRA